MAVCRGIGRCELGGRHGCRDGVKRREEIGIEVGRELVARYQAAKAISCKSFLRFPGMAGMAKVAICRIHFRRVTIVGGRNVRDADVASPKLHQRGLAKPLGVFQVQLVPQRSTAEMPVDHIRPTHGPRQRTAPFQRAQPAAYRIFLPGEEAKSLHLGGVQMQLLLVTRPRASIPMLRRARARTDICEPMFVGSSSTLTRSSSGARNRFVGCSADNVNYALDLASPHAGEDRQGKGQSRCEKRHRIQVEESVLGHALSEDGETGKKLCRIGNGDLLLGDAGLERLQGCAGLGEGTGVLQERFQRLRQPPADKRLVGILAGIRRRRRECQERETASALR